MPAHSSLARAQSTCCTAKITSLLYHKKHFRVLIVSIFRLLEYGCWDNQAQASQMSEMGVCEGESICNISKRNLCTYWSIILGLCQWGAKDVVIIYCYNVW